jgi:hypothetical protein
MTPSRRAGCGKSACPVRGGGGRRRSDGEASEAPSTERDGNRWALLYTTAPTLDPTAAHPPSLQRVTTKPAIVKALDDSVVYCSSLIATASEAWLLESAPNLGGAGSGRITGARAYALIYAGIHGAEDYGTITTYLRMQGLLPPSTALVQSEPR